MANPLAMAKHFQEELESYMQGETNLYLLGHFGVSLVRNI